MKEKDIYEEFITIKNIEFNKTSILAIQCG